MTFGTVKQVSMGPTSLMALLTYEYTKNLTPEYVVLLTFMCGIVEMLMGLLKLGKSFARESEISTPTDGIIFRLPDWTALQNNDENISKYYFLFTV